MESEEGVLSRRRTPILTPLEARFEFIAMKIDAEDSGESKEMARVLGGGLGL